ncbi:MAG: hypothetical protein WCJ15_04355 [Alphaproteobacteria bacterium]
MTGLGAREKVRNAIRSGLDDRRGADSGRTNVPYQWRNPNSGNYGEVRVNNYFNDSGGFRCANFNQKIFVRGRPQAATGRACQQPDGTWTVVN